MNKQALLTGEAAEAVAKLKALKVGQIAASAARKILAPRAGTGGVISNNGAS